MADPLVPGQRPIWEDPWWNVWDQFRKHVIDLHYDELSAWVHESGIARDRIFSAQGLIHDVDDHAPFSLRIDSPSPSYDSAGVSVEGAIPRDGHLGAVLYGHTARNDLVLENRRSLFATLGRMDDGWGIVEYNNTNLRFPDRLPDYEMAYLTFREAFNYGAREVSAMAWNGSNGIYAGKPGYVAYTAWRNTAAEEAMRDFLVAHADVPWGARLWTFGTPQHVDADGWTADRGTLRPGTGFATLVGEGGSIALASPPDQVIRPASIDRLMLQFAPGSPSSLRMKVYARTAGDAWVRVADAADSATALEWPTAWRHVDTIVEQLKIELAFAPDTGPVTLTQILLYPREPENTTRQTRVRTPSLH